MPLPDLPSELFEHILTQVDEDERATTTLSLMRAMPRISIPQRILFEHVHLRQPQQVVQLERRLRQRNGKEMSKLVKVLKMKAWDADAEVVANLLLRLQDLTSLVLYAGPYVAHETLAGIFKKPLASLESLTLRFRPYVQRANYLQFLKGAYFDSTIVALSQWAPCALRRLSIIQDPLIDRTPFAQPLVFFNLHPFVALSSAPLTSHLHSLCIRIPGRNVVPFLTITPRRLRALTNLDLGTGRISAADLTQILARIPYIRHARLDRCAVHAGIREELPGDGSGAVGVDADGELARLGRACALAGVKRAREKEKFIRAAREALDEDGGGDGGGGDGGAPVAPQRPRARAGRKGLATATISLRGANDVGALAEPAVMAAPVQNHLTGYAESNEIIHGVQNMTLGTKANERNVKVRMAAVPPLLRTLCITLRNTPPSGHIDFNDDMTTTHEFASEDSIEAIRAQHEMYRAEFTRGWMEGVVTLRAGWARLRTSERAGLARVAVFRDALGLQDPRRSIDGSESIEPDADALVFLDEVGWGVLDGDAENLEGGWPPPLVCFAGEEMPLDSGLHIPGCGHEVTNGSWDD